MTPFEEFRKWLRRGPREERRLAGVAALVVLGLLAWAVMPTTSSTQGEGAPSGQVAAASGTQAQASASSGAGQAGPGAVGGQVSGNGTGAGRGTPAGSLAGSGGQAAGSSGAAVAASSLGAVQPAPSGPGTPATGTRTAPAAGGTTVTNGGRACPPSDPSHGLTDTTLLIAVTAVDLAGANSALDLPSVSQIEAQYQAYANYVNAHGGIGCRKLALKDFADNPVDTNGEHSTCLQMVADHVFANLGGLYSAQNAYCPAQHGIVEFDLTGAPTNVIKQYYPYYFSTYPDSVTAFREFVFGAKQNGWFNGVTPGKLGILEQDCIPEDTSELLAPLARIGYTSGFVTYDFGCNSAAGSAAQQQQAEQAVLKFKTAGVTHVINAGVGMQTFASVADKQAYYPQYAVNDNDNTVFTSVAEGNPDPKSFNGAFAITGSQYGGYNSHLTPTPATATCDAILKAGGAPPTEEYDAYGGTVCNQFAMFYQGALHARTLAPQEIGPGLDSVGHLDMSYPAAPAEFNAIGVASGGQYWRPLHYDGVHCDCWLVTSPQWSPSFTADGSPESY